MTSCTRPVCRMPSALARSICCSARNTAVLCWRPASTTVDAHAEPGGHSHEPDRDDGAGDEDLGQGEPALPRTAAQPVMHCVHGCRLRSGPAMRIAACHGVKKLEYLLVLDKTRQWNDECRILRLRQSATAGVNECSRPGESAEEARGRHEHRTPGRTPPEVPAAWLEDRRRSPSRRRVSLEGRGGGVPARDARDAGGGGGGGVGGASGRTARGKSDPLAA